MEEEYPGKTVSLLTLGSLLEKIPLTGLMLLVILEDLQLRKEKEYLLTPCVSSTLRIKLRDVTVVKRSG